MLYEIILNERSFKNKEVRKGSCVTESLKLSQFATMNGTNTRIC